MTASWDEFMSRRHLHTCVSFIEGQTQQADIRNHILCVFHIDDASSDADDDDDEGETLEAVTRSLNTLKKTSTRSGGAAADGAEEGDAATEPEPGSVTRQPEVVDDFFRNFLVKMGLHRTLESFETEWYVAKKRACVIEKRSIYVLLTSFCEWTHVCCRSFPISVDCPYVLHQLHQSQPNDMRECDGCVFALLSLSLSLSLSLPPGTSSRRRAS